MVALDGSAELMRRGAELRARSLRMRAAADEKMAKSRRLLAVTAFPPDSGPFYPVPAQTAALVQRSQEARARARATREQVVRGRSRREVLHDSAFARLRARQRTMPVIEQAKGIIMAQQRCGPEEAFDLLRQASQRTNVKVHVLAARIVGQMADGDGDNVTPITLGATRYPRTGPRARSPAE